jgi:hypothetical protein
VSAPEESSQFSSRIPIRDSKICHLALIQKKLENWTSVKGEKIEKRRPALAKELLGLRQKKRGEGKSN